MSPKQNIRFCIATGILGGGDHFLPAATPGGPQMKIQYCTKSRAEGELAYHVAVQEISGDQDEDSLYFEDLAMALKDATQDSPTLFNMETHEPMFRLFRFTANKISLELSRSKYFFPPVKSLYLIVNFQGGGHGAKKTNKERFILGSEISAQSGMKIFDGYTGVEDIAVIPLTLFNFNGTGGAAFTLESRLISFAQKYASTVQGNILARRITVGMPGSAVININFSGVGVGRTRNGRTDTLSVGLERVIDRFVAELQTSGVFTMSPVELSYAAVKSQLDQKFDSMTPQQMMGGIVLFPIGTNCYTAQDRIQPAHQAVVVQPVQQPNQAALLSVIMQLLAGGGAPAAIPFANPLLQPPANRNNYRNLRRKTGANQHRQFGGEGQGDDDQGDGEDFDEEEFR